MTKRLLFSLLVLSTSLATKAQEDSLDNTDYSQFGDAAGVKRYATQKVLNQSPQRIVSIGYEYQSSFLMPGVPFYPTQLPALDYSLRNVSGLRAQVNVPVISNTKLIWQLGANYANSAWQFETPNTANPFITQLNSRGMHTFGLNTTIFKPLNEKRFLIFQANADINGVFSKPGDISSKALTFSGAALYGWKFSERNMLGVGIAEPTGPGGYYMFRPCFGIKHFLINGVWNCCCRPVLTCVAIFQLQVYYNSVMSWKETSIGCKHPVRTAWYSSSVAN